MGAELGRLLKDAGQTLAKMPEVGVIDAKAEHFVNDRREVGKRADHAQRSSLRRTLQSPRACQHHRVLDHSQRHAAGE